jgi:hypothetical protein
MSASNDKHLNSKNEIALAEFITAANATGRYLLSKWWMITLAAVIGGVLGVVVAWLQKPKYQSLLTFSLEENSGGLGNALSIAAEFGFNLGGGGKDIFAGENIITILTSRRVVEGVLLSADTFQGKTSTLADYYLQISNLKKKYTNHPRLGTINFPPTLERNKFSYHQDSVLFVIYKQIVTSALVSRKPDRKLNLYEVSFISPEERFSKLFTERLIQKAISFYTELRTKRSKQTLQVLEEQVASLSSSAKGAIQYRAEVQDANLNPAFADQSAKIQQKQLDLSAYGGAYAELFKNLELARYQYLQDVPLLQVIDAPAYPLKLIKRGRLLTGLAGAIVFGLLAIFYLYLRRSYKKIISSLPPSA